MTRRQNMKLDLAEIVRLGLAQLLLSDGERGAIALQSRWQVTLPGQHFADLFI